MDDDLRGFGIAPDAIFRMLSPPNGDTLTDLGGTEGLARLLKTGVSTGLDFGNSEDLTSEDIVARRTVFGTNETPTPPLKSLWSFVVEAFSEDKLLRLLSLAALIEIGLGTYKTIKTGNSLELIEGFAVLLTGMHRRS